MKYYSWDLIYTFIIYLFPGTCHNLKDQLIMENNEIGKKYNNASKSVITDSFIFSQIQKSESVCDENLKSCSLVGESVFIEEILFNVDTNCADDNKEMDIQTSVAETQTFKTCNDLLKNYKIVSSEKNCTGLEEIVNSEKRKKEILEECKDKSKYIDQLNITQEGLFEKIQRNVTQSGKKKMVKTEIVDSITQNVPSVQKLSDSHNSLEKNFVGTIFEDLAKMNPKENAIERSNKIEISFPNRGNEIFDSQVSKSSFKTEEIVSESNILNDSCEILSGSNCASVMTKKKEKPRIIKNVALKEPMILKKKISDKSCRKFKIIADSNFRFVKSKNISKIKNMKTDGGKFIHEKSSSMVNKKAMMTEKAVSGVNNENAATIKSSMKSCFTTKNVSSVALQNDVLIKGYSSNQGLLNITEMDLDINSMPLILSKDLLTPESIQQMPVVISSALPLNDMLESTTVSTTSTTKTAHQISNRNNDPNSMVGNKKNLSDPPANFKNKSKGKPMITSIKTIVPPLNSTLFKGAYKINRQTFKALDKRNKNFGNYVIVQASGPKSIHSRHEVKNKSSTNTPSTSHAQIVQQDGKVVIITPSQNSSLKSENKHGLFNTHVPKTAPSIIMHTSISQQFSQFNPTSTISAIKNTNDILKTVSSDSSVKDSENQSSLHHLISKQHSSDHITKKREMNYPVTDSIQYLITSEKPITSSINNTLSQSNILFGSKNIVTTGLLSFKKADQKMLIKAIPRSVSKTIITPQGIMSKSPVLTPITGSQVKALAAKNINVRKMPIQSRTLQNKTIICKKVKDSLLKESNAKAMNFTHAQNDSSQHPSNQMQKISLEKEEFFKLSVNPTKQTGLTPEPVFQTDCSLKKNLEKEFIITESKLKFEKSLLNPKQRNSSHNIYSNKTTSEKEIDLVSTNSRLLKNYLNSTATENFEQVLNEKQLCKKEIKIFEAPGNKEMMNLNINSLEFNKAHDQILKSIPKSSVESPLLAVPTNSSDGTSTYILVSVDEKGLITPLDKSTLIACEEIPQNIVENKIHHFDSSTLTEKNDSKNVVLQIENNTLYDVQSKMDMNIEITQDSKISKDLYLTKIRKSNPDILAVALADTDFHRETSTIEDMEVNLVSNYSQTSLINQTILQSTIIPPTEPITSSSVLETTSTLNHPIMTPFEVPSTPALQSKLASACGITVENSAELPIILSDSNFEPITESTTLSLNTCSTSSFENEKEKVQTTTLSMPIIDDACCGNIDLDSSKELFNRTRTEDIQRHSMKLFEESDFNHFFQVNSVIINLIIFVLLLHRCFDNCIFKSFLLTSLISLNTQPHVIFNIENKNKKSFIFYIQS